MDTEKEKFREDLLETAKILAQEKFGVWRMFARVFFNVGVGAFFAYLTQIFQWLGDFKFLTFISIESIEIALVISIIIKLKERSAIKEEQEKLKKTFAEMDEYEKRSVEENA